MSARALKPAPARCLLEGLEEAVRILADPDIDDTAALRFAAGATLEGLRNSLAEDLEEERNG